jgi:hypothetical protein
VFPSEGRSFPNPYGLSSHPKGGLFRTLTRGPQPRNPVDPTRGCGRVLIRRTRLALATTAVAVGLTACAHAPQSSSPERVGATQKVAKSGKEHHHDSMDGMDMSGMDMSSAAKGPSKTAAMICTEDEIKDGVAKSLDLTSPPQTRDHWSHLLYTCTYQLDGGNLVLAVKDSADEMSGRAYFKHLRGELPGAHKLKGLAALGLPSFETDRGDVVFIKDGKTLHVDATAVPATALPKGQSRTGVAYQVATDVIACWSE